MIYMFEIFFIIILLGSLIGIGIMMLIKIPVLVELTPEENQVGFFGRMKQKIKTHGALRFFSGELLLHTLLSKFRVLTLKTENKTSTLLTNLRQKSIEKKNGESDESTGNPKFSDDYWKKVKRKK